MRSRGQSLLRNICDSLEENPPRSPFFKGGCPAPSFIKGGPGRILLNSPIPIVNDLESPLSPAPFDRLTTPLSREGRGRIVRGQFSSQ
jgi:hypothetical protein